MTKFANPLNTLYDEFEIYAKFVRVPAFITAATREKSAHFCRYSHKSVKRTKFVSIIK